MKKQKTFLLTEKALKNLEDLKILFGISLNEVVEKSINNLAEISNNKQKMEILANNFEKNSTQISYQYQQIAIQLLEFKEEISSLKQQLKSYEQDKEMYKNDLIKYKEELRTVNSNTTTLLKTIHKDVENYLKTLSKLDTENLSADTIVDNISKNVQGFYGAIKTTIFKNKE